LNRAKHGFGLLFKKYEGRILSNIRLEVLQAQKGNAQRNKYRFVKLDTDTDQPKTSQQDLTKPAENKPDTNGGKEEMNGLNGLNGSTNPSNIKNNVNSNIGEYIETPQIPQTPQTSAENSQNSNTILDNQPPAIASKPMETQPPQNDNATPPQNPTKPANTPAATTKSSTSSHSDAQVQVSPQVFSPQPETPALENHNANTSTQSQDTRQKETLQRTFIAVKISKGEAFWLDPEQKKPNSKLSAVLQGLPADMIKEALKSLQWQGYIYETKPNYWYTARDLHLVDVVAYDNPSMSVYCPSCGKPTTRLYWYDTGWLCIDCLNSKQHQSDELFGE